METLYTEIPFPRGRILAGKWTTMPRDSPEVLLTARDPYIKEYRPPPLSGKSLSCVFLMRLLIFSFLGNDRAFP